MPVPALKRFGLWRAGDFHVFEGGWVPRGMHAWTLGRVVIVRNGAVTPYLLAHEAVHVEQWRRHGILGFPVRYAAGYLRGRAHGKGHLGAYRRIPMEIEADWRARRALRRVVSNVGDDMVPHRAP